MGLNFPDKSIYSNRMIKSGLSNDSGQFSKLGRLTDSGWLTDLD